MTPKFVSQLNISQSAVLLFYKATCIRAVELGLNIAFSIAVEAGILILVSRMENSPLNVVSTAQSNTLTDIGFGLATWNTGFNLFWNASVPMDNTDQTDNYIVLENNYPVQIKRSLSGFIGVGGANSLVKQQCSFVGQKAAGF